MIANSGNMQGGGGIETCTGTFTGGGRFPLAGYYIDGNGELQSFEASTASGGTVQATVAKNSIVIAYNPDGTYRYKSGEIQEIENYSHSFYVTGDFSIEG